MEPQPVNNSKTILTIAVTALITALIVGGGVYLWQRSVAQQEIQQAVEKVKQETAQPGSQSNSSNLQTYRDEQYGFEFNYPKNWMSKESGIAGETVLSAKDFSTEGSEGAPISIVVYKNEKNLSLQEYFDVKNNDSGRLLMDPRAVEYTFFKELKPVNTNVANTASLKFETGDYNIMVIPHNNKIYEILYVKGLDQKNQKDSQVLANILSTLKFFEPRAPVDTSNWKSYQNTSQYFSIQYPTDWYIIQPTPETDLSIQNYSDLVREKSLKNKILIGIGFKNQLSDFLAPRQSSIKTFQDAVAQERALGIETGGNAGELKKITINGNLGYRWEGKRVHSYFSPNNAQEYEIQAYILAQNRVYYFTSILEQGTPENLAAVNTVLNSIKFTK